VSSYLSNALANDACWDELIMMFSARRYGDVAVRYAMFTSLADLQCVPKNETRVILTILRSCKVQVDGNIMTDDRPAC